MFAILSAIFTVLSAIFKVLSAILLKTVNRKWIHCFTLKFRPLIAVFI